MSRHFAARQSIAATLITLAGLTLGACTSGNGVAFFGGSSQAPDNQPVDTRTRTSAVTQAKTPTANQPETPRALYNPTDPFAAHSAFERSSRRAYASEVFPAGLEGFEGRPGVTTSPQFSIFGELPSQHSAGSRHLMANDATENLRQISFGTEGADFDVSVSRTGQRVYFASTRHRPTADIYYKSVDGRSVTQLTSDPAHDVMPSESPDGQRIAFASNRNGSWDIYVMNAFGGQAVQITDDTGQELHPSWSPDGQTLAYCRLSDASDRWELWTVDIGAPSVKRFIGYGLFPTWHPSESKILFQRSRDRGDRFFSVWTIDYVNGEGVAPTEVASSPVAAVINPTWSPDGDRIAFATVFNPDALNSSSKPETADIWMMNLDGTSRANLTGGWYVNLMPSWGPDGRIYFVSNRNGADNIWSIGPEQAMVAAGEAPVDDSSYAEYAPGAQSSTATATVPVPEDDAP